MQEHKAQKAIYRHKYYLTHMEQEKENAKRHHLANIELIKKRQHDTYLRNKSLRGGVNIMARKKRKNKITEATWLAVQTLTEAGVRNNDIVNALKIGLTSVSVLKRSSTFKEYEAYRDENIRMIKENRERKDALNGYAESVGTEIAPEPERGEVVRPQVDDSREDRLMTILEKINVNLERMVEAWENPEVKKKRFPIW